MLYDTLHHWMLLAFTINKGLTTGKNEKEYSWHVPAIKFIGMEAVGLKSCKYTLKITIFVKMWNLGQYRENLIFCQQLLNWNSNLKNLLHTCDKYNCDYLKHSTFRFNLFDFQLNTDFPSQFCFLFYRKITYRHSKNWFLKKMLIKRAKTRRLFFKKTIGSDNYFTLIENNFRFLRKLSLNSR